MIEQHHPPKSNSLEEALKSEKGFRTIVENTAVAVAITDLSGRVIYVNKTLADLSGYSVEEILGRNFIDYIHPDDRARIQSLFLKSTALQRPPPNVEFRQIHKDGHVLYLMSKPTIFTIDGKTVGFQTIIIDITERKKMEEEIKRLARFPDENPNPILELSQEGIILYANEASKMLLQNWGCKVGDYAPEFWHNLVTETLRKKTSISININLGTQIYLFFITPVVDADYANFYGIDVTERRNVEETLRDSEERFRAISDSAIDAIAVMDDEGKITYWNPAAERMFGYKKEEVIGKELHKTLLPKGFRETFELGFRVFKETGTGSFVGKTVELTMIGKDGREVQVELSTSTLKTKGKWHAVGIIRDITERRKIENSLRESEEKWRSLVENAPNVILIVDRDGKIQFINRTVIDASPEEMIGKSIYNYIDPRYQDVVRKIIEQVFQTGESSGYEVSGTGSSGSTSWYKTHVGPIKHNGQVVSVTLITTDITEIKKAEERLKESEERLKQLIEYAPDTIYMNDLKGNFTDGNKQAENLTGYKKEELIGKNFLKIGLLPKRYVLKATKALMKNLLGQKTGPEEFELIRKDGSHVTAEISTFPVKKGGKTEVIGIARDITERKNMERKLKEYREHLEEKVEERTQELKKAHERLMKSERLAAIGELASMVGHDLRNPLTGIAGATYYLKTKLNQKTDEKTKEMLELIEENVKYSDKIISDLVEYSREIKLELTKTTSKSIVKGTLFLVEVPKNIHILDSTENEPEIKADVERMKRVFINIIKNGIDAMPNGGKLRIVSKEKDSNNLEIVFSDTGTGMPKEVLEKIWTPFFTTKSKGMGLGLSICKRIIEAHGGIISVESIVGKGTTFTITIPTQPKQEGGEKVWVKMSESLLSTTTKA